MTKLIRNRLQRIIVTVVGPLVALPAFAADEAVCLRVFALSHSLISNKENGKTEDEVRAPLLPLSNSLAPSDIPSASDNVFLLHQMHELVDDVYGGQTPDQLTYSVYQAEKCYRSINGLAVPSSFEDAREKLAECSMKNREEAITCAMMAAGSQPE